MKAKKLISALLLVCMLASVMTVSAFADGVTKITLNVTSSGGASTVGADADITVNVGDTFTITPSSEAAEGADRSVTYSVASGSDKISATGAPDGSTGAQTYKAVSAGTAQVVVTSNSTPEVHANCNVTVNPLTVAPDPTVTPTPTPTPAPSTSVSIEGVSRVRLGESIRIRANVTNGSFGYWEIDSVNSTGMGSIDVISGNQEVTFTGTKVGQVRVIAHAKDSSASAELWITVSEVRTPVVVCNVKQILQNDYGYFSVSNAENSEEQFTWTYTTSPNGVDIVKDFRDYKTGVDVYAGKGSGTVTVTATDKYGKSGSLTIPVNSVDGVDVTLAPKTTTWAKGQGNLTFTVSPNFYAAYMDGVCFTGSGNTDKYSHVWSSNNLIIKSSYLATLSAGQHTLRVDTVYANGTSAGSAYATITISGTASAIYGDNAHVRGNSNNLIFTSTGGVKNVYISNQLIDPANYTLSADGKTLTLKASFLNLLNYGTYTMRLDTQNGGTETTSFRIVTANYAPATGDESNLAIWVAVLLISGAGAVALIPRRKKEM